MVCCLTCETVVCSGSDRSSSTVSSSRDGRGLGDRTKLTVLCLDFTGDMRTTDSSPRSNSQFRLLSRSLYKKENTKFIYNDHIAVVWSQ